MDMGMERGDRAGPAEAIAELSEELARTATLAREQAAELAHYKKMYDRASALARIGVWECDLATERLSWTDGVYDLFELPRGTPVERLEIVDLYDPESRREMERLRSNAIKDGGSFSLEIKVRTAHGNQRWLRLTADVERENGKSVRIFGTKQDITEEKAAQEKVRSLQSELIHVTRRSAMGAMASTLAHELNQPLAAIGNYAAGSRRALEAGNQAEAVAASIVAIERCALRAGNIIRSLRAITRESTSMRQTIAAGPLVREAAALAMAAGGEAVKLDLDLADRLPVSADPVQIQQVIVNLVRNAIDAVQGSTRREIAVGARIAGGEVRIQVDDSGPGIKPELIDRLFESFVTSKPDGMGVGLSICRTIVEAHGGRITAANRAGGGASLLVALPAAGRGRNNGRNSPQVITTVS